MLAVLGEHKQRVAAETIGSVNFHPRDAGEAETPAQPAAMRASNPERLQAVVGFSVR